MWQGDRSGLLSFEVFWMKYDHLLLLLFLMFSVVGVEVSGDRGSSTVFLW